MAGVACPGEHSTSDHTGGHLRNLDPGGVRRPDLSGEPVTGEIAGKFVLTHVGRKSSNRQATRNARAEGPAEANRRELDQEESTA